MSYQAIILTEENIDKYDLPTVLNVSREWLLGRIAEDQATGMSSNVYLDQP